MAEVYMAGDVRNGTTFELDGSVYKVVEFQHVKPGKGAAFVRTKLKNVINGSVLEKHSTHQKNYKGADIEKEKCNIYMQMEIYIILWIMKHTTKFHLINQN